MSRVTTYFQGLPRQAQLTLLIAIAAFALLTYLLCAPLVRIWMENRAAIDTMEPRIGRMLGFEASGEELAQSLDSARGQLALYTYDPGEDLAGLGASLQQLVRELAEDSGLSVAGSQPVGGEGTEGIDAVQVNVELRGGVEAMERFLMELSAATPLIHLQSLRIIAPRLRRGEDASTQSVSATVRVSAYRIQASV